MRNCQPIQIAILLLCGAVVSAAQGTGASATVGKTVSRNFASGLALLGKHDCKQAAISFQQDRSVEASILLGLAYDCSANKEKLDVVFRHIWDHDLDPQEPTAEITLIENELKAGLRFHPQTLPGKYFAALLDYRMESYDSALEKLQSAAAPAGDSWAYFNLLGSVYLRQSHFPEAKQALEAALVRDDKRADTYYKLGTALLATGDVTTATTRLKQAVKLRQDFPAANAALGMALLQAGDFAAARDFLSKGTAVGPEIYVYLGTANERLNDSKAAIDDYRTALAQQPQLFAAEFGLGRLLLRSGDSTAVDHLQRATQIDSTDPQAQLYFAMALVAARQIESAVNAAQTALTLGTSEGADFHDALGSVLQDLSQQPETVQSFQKAVMMSDPANENYVRHLAAAQHKAGDTAGAITTLRSGIVRSPASARLNYLLGISLMANGSSADALQPLRGATELEPKNFEYEQSLGLCLAELERDSDAMIAFQKVLALDPNQAPAYLQIGILQLKTNPDLAEQSFKKAAEVGPNYAPAYFHLGKIAYDRNDDTQALKLLEKTRELDPDWEDTYFLLGVLYKRAGKEDESAQMLATFRKRKNELQDLRRKTFEMAPNAFDDTKPMRTSR
ncbi:MAG TPA: tetratricopeptide repeat protein [Terriglobales bacterium]|jgi:tetratricopeptide (TPR) repeat protein|nr:tetratricopeptide repeat protein [Terriglobales bacterium]